MRLLPRSLQLKASYQPSQVEYVFPEGTTLGAGETVEVYSQEGDHVLEGKLVDVVGFTIP